MADENTKDPVTTESSASQEAVGAKSPVKDDNPGTAQKTVRTAKGTTGGVRKIVARTLESFLYGLWTMVAVQLASPQAQLLPPTGSTSLYNAKVTT